MLQHSGVAPKIAVVNRHEKETGHIQNQKWPRSLPRQSTVQNYARTVRNTDPR